MIALERIARAHDELVEAMDTADRLKAEGLAAARGNIDRLGQLATQLRERAAGLLEQAEDSRPITMT